jgi:hypothetical protein
VAQIPPGEGTVQPGEEMDVLVLGPL